MGFSDAYLAGNHKAAQRAAVMYTILAFYKADDINPLPCLANVVDNTLLGNQSEGLVSEGDSVGEHFRGTTNLTSNNIFDH